MRVNMRNLLAATAMPLNFGNAFSAMKKKIVENLQRDGEVFYDGNADTCDVLVRPLPER